MERLCAVLIVWCLAIVRASAGADCAAPVAIEPSLDGPVKPVESVADYDVILKSCHKLGADDAQAVIAIREMTVGGEKLLLTVDPENLTTRLERAACWSCGPPDGWEASRYGRAVSAFAAARSKKKRPLGSNWLENAGLTHGQQGGGAFVTGDLCPSHPPLERSFLLDLEKAEAPVALSITGVWIKQHPEDFLWLRREKAEGRLNVLWVNHSFRHPFRSDLPYGETFILTPGLIPKDEILNVERLLIANGERPSVFFRFPGLISSDIWMERLRDAHLIPLGADAWLALGQKPTPGGIVLVHPNGNEPRGLDDFKRLERAGAMPKPYRPLEEAP